jgi:hypothetical protein
LPFPDPPVASCNKLSTNFRHSSDSVGKPLCRALAGSGGITGHCTTTGGKGSGTLAQAVSSSRGASSISFSLCGALGLLVDDFGDGLDTARFFIAGILGCLAGGYFAPLLALGVRAGHLR